MGEWDEMQENKWEIPIKALLLVERFICNKAVYFMERLFKRKKKKKIEKINSDHINKRSKNKVFHSRGLLFHFIKFFMIPLPFRH